jgi:acetate---CoA ligase (ADP-forming)
MKKFMEPRSVALIGISSKVGKGSLNLFENLLQIGYPGKIYPVNPKIQKLLGQEVFKDILAIPENIDLAVIMTPRQVVPNVLEQCVKKAIDSVLIITQGFAESDEEGKVLQSKIDKIIKETGIRVLGPNSIGTVNRFVPFSTYFLPIEREESPIAFISQSGGFLEGFPQFKIGKGIDLGNTCDIDFDDALNYFEDDPKIRVIGVYMEGIRNGKKFLETARRVAQKKLVLVLKAGKSAVGAKAILSHSGSLAGEEIIFEVALKQAGLIRIRNVEEFGDISKAFFNLPPFQGNRIGVVTPTGAGGILILDSCQEYGFQLATFSENQIEEIKDIFLPWQKVINPLDIMSSALVHGYKMVYAKALETLFKDNQVDVIFCVLGEPTLKTVKEVANKYPTKPLVSWVIGQPTSSHRGTEVPVSYPSAERALRSLAAVMEYQDLNMRKQTGKIPFSTDRKSVERMLKIVSQRNQKILTAEAFSILSAYGIPVVPFKIVKTENQALKVAKALNYPVVLKICSPEILHKSDINGVRIGIRDPKELRFYYDDMVSGVIQRIPNLKIEGVIIQKMITEGIELILGAKRDPQFGHMIVFGWGGVFTEALNDVSCAIAPITLEDTDRMIFSTKVSKLLQSFRGNPPSDLFFLKECLLRLSQLVSDFPEIKELDINPLKIFSKSGLVLDARIVID